jgi:NAD+ synthase
MDTTSQNNGADWMAFDVAAEAERSAARLREILSRDLKRRGLVVGLSGGIDSSVTAALAVKALGPTRVFGLLMPERHSEAGTLGLSRSVAESLGIEFVHEDISGILEATGFYRRYDDAVREVVPEFGAGWKSKIVIQGAGDATGFNYFELVTQAPSGQVTRQRLPLKTYLGIVAATNFKQRIRKMLEYYHADRLNFAVAGTPNRLEYDQGFFVKNGDGSADVKPIAHLYKSQVYELAAFLNVPEQVRQRPPTTDTYSLAQGQDEFYFLVPYRQMDLCLYAKNHGLGLEETARAAGLPTAMVERVWVDIERKRSATRYHHLPPVLVADVPEIQL